MWATPAGGGRHMYDQNASFRAQNQLLGAKIQLLDYRQVGLQKFRACVFRPAQLKSNQQTLPHARMRQSLDPTSSISILSTRAPSRWARSSGGGGERSQSPAGTIPNILPMSEMNRAAKLLTFLPAQSKSTQSLTRPGKHATAR